MSIQARRHSPRVKLGANTYINLGSGNRGVIRDVSDGGLGFSTNVPIQSGREIRFRFPFGDKLELVADLAWNDQSRTRGGLRFKTVPPEIRAQLRAWMEQAPSPNDKSELETPGLSGREEQTISLEVTGLGPEVARSRESDERIAAAAVEIIAEEKAEKQAAEDADSARLEPKPEVEDEATASSTVSFGSFSWSVPGAESKLTMFPPDSTGAFAFSSRARRGRRNLLGVAVIILLCAVGAAGAALWYVYPNQTQYEIQRAQDRIAGLIISGHWSGSGPGHKQPISNVEPASIGGAVPGNPDKDFASAVPGGAPAPPDVTGAQGVGGSEPVLKTQYPAVGESAVPTDQSPTPVNQSETELALARTYLANESTPDQKAKAVQLLWLATEKGNIDAEIQLADLYSIGEDVPKSCVQARILLKAAQVANPSVAEPKLKELEQAGCS